MTPEQKKALGWASNQDFQSVAATYARVLAVYINELFAENERLKAEFKRQHDIEDELTAVCVDCMTIQPAYAFVDDKCMRCQKHRRMETALREIHIQTVAFDERFETTGEMGTETIAEIGSLAEKVLNGEEWRDDAKAEPPTA